MKNGARPAVQDPRDYSQALTFGTIQPEVLPSEYSCDGGQPITDQNADGNPYSCTAYGTTDVGADQDGIIYSPEYTYCKTLFSQGLPPETNGSDIRPALKTAKVYGLLPKVDVPLILKDRGEDFTANQSNWPVGVDSISGKMEHRKGNYFNVYEDSGLDWFDSIRSALYKNRADKRAVILGTPWLWLSAPQGFLTKDFVYNGNPNSVSWHCWNIKGWTMIGGKQYLIGKPWQGTNYGANGFVYVSRECINKVMPIRGAIAFTLADATAAEIETIKIGMAEQVLFYLNRLLVLLNLAKARLA